MTRARSVFTTAKKRHLAQPTDAVAAWEFGRACFDLAGLATNGTEKARIAGLGITACRQAITNHPGSARAHYYLGMMLGQVADTRKNLTALRMVREIEREFKMAHELDEHFSFAGPDRNLGLLYLNAPVIGSVGNRRKARQHLQRAVELAPDYPENRLNLIEAHLQWDDYNRARSELKSLEKLWPKARIDLSGEEWEPSWVDWEKRFKTAREKVGVTPRHFDSPHAKD